MALKWHLPQEPYAQQAMELLTDWRNGIWDFTVPDIFFAELANALTRAVRQGRILPSEAEAILQDLLLMPAQVQPTLPLIDRAFEIALQHQQSAYDCIYVALAEREGIELWTGDERLFNALSVHFPFVRFIGNYVPQRSDLT